MQKIKKQIIQNKYLKVSTLNIGASLFEVIFKSKKINLILNLDNIENYKYKHQYIGSTCGRYSNRISNGFFFIRGKKYNLTKNDKKNTLHGGKEGFDKKIWKLIHKSKDKIIYNLISKDLDQGFPGNLNVKIEYKLKNNKLISTYTYFSDKYTHVSLTNHSYWNLNQNKNLKIFNHDIKINSNHYLPVNKKDIPLGNKKSVYNTFFDLRKFNNIGRKTLNGKKGIDVNYVVNSHKSSDVVTLINKKTKIKLKLKTNQPGLQFYTGHKLSSFKNPINFSPFQGLCLESQYFPNSPNEKNFPSTLVIPNKKYVMKTYYTFEDL